jgi:hypothetical protein
MSWQTGARAGVSFDDHEQEANKSQQGEDHATATSSMGQWLTNMLADFPKLQQKIHFLIHLTTGLLQAEEGEKYKEGEKDKEGEKKQDQDSVSLDRPDFFSRELRPNLDKQELLELISSALYNPKAREKLLKLFSQPSKDLKTAAAIVASLAKKNSPVADEILSNILEMSPQHEVSKYLSAIQKKRGNSFEFNNKAHGKRPKDEPVFNPTPSPYKSR